MSIIKLNNNGVKNATAFGSGVTSLGSMVFIKKLTASSSSTLSFVDGASSVVLDNTYKEYLFTFKDIHPSERQDFQFNMSVDGGSNYNVTKTSTFFRSQHAENGNHGNLAYQSDKDLAQSTNFQTLGQYLAVDGSDACSAGILHLFNPSSTTFVKHFTCTFNSLYESATNRQQFIAGYGNTTSAVDAIQFKMSSGNIDAGDICLYGIA